MQGYNGNFRPADHLSRAEMAAVIVRSLGLKEETDLTAYSDIDASSWYYSDMSKACLLYTSGNTADTETSVTGLPEAGADGVITLTENVEISSAQWPVMSEGLTIDLQQYTLTISGGSTIYIPQGQTLTIKNSKIIANEFPNGITAVFSAKEDASIILNSVQMMTNGSALFPAGNAASVEVTDSEISAGTYAVGTNALSLIHI